MKNERLQIVFWIFVVVFAIVFLVHNFKVNAAAPPLFDHSNCQYPDRLSNPPAGCDNSDPARPECVKFGFEECDLPPPTAPTPTPAPIAAPAASQEPEIPYIPPTTGK